MAQLHGDIKPLDITSHLLPSRYIKTLEEVIPFDQLHDSEHQCVSTGPWWLMPSLQGDGTYDPLMVTTIGNTDKWPFPSPITSAHTELSQHRTVIPQDSCSEISYCTFYSIILKAIE